MSTLQTMEGHPPTDVASATIDPPAWWALIARGSVGHVHAGQRIHDVDRLPGVVAVMSGGLRVFGVLDDGRQLTLFYAAPGQVLGLRRGLSERGLVSAEAVTDSIISSVPLERLHELALETPALAWALMEQTTQREAEMVGLLMCPTPAPTWARIARHLLVLAKPTDDGLAARVTHVQLAEAVGTAREVVTRTMGDLRRHGIVRTSHGWTWILDQERLAGIAGGARISSEHVPA